MPSRQAHRRQTTHAPMASPCVRGELTKLHKRTPTFARETVYKKRLGCCGQPFSPSPLMCCALLPPGRANCHRQKFHAGMWPAFLDGDGLHKGIAGCINRLIDCCLLRAQLPPKTAHVFSAMQGLNSRPLLLCWGLHQQLGWPAILRTKSPGNIPADIPINVPTNIPYPKQFCMHVGRVFMSHVK